VLAASTLATAAFLPMVAHAEEVRVALAANFAAPFAVIARDFEAATGHRAIASVGSTAKLYAQIRNGAPYAVFLAADTLHPQLLVQEELAVPGTRITYAVGRLVLWSADARRIGADGAAALRAPDLHRIAIANPRIAPYGRAAEQTLRALGSWDAVRSRLVQGESIAQALQFVESGNAQCGFVALAQVLDPRLAGRGSRWDVPASLHEPLQQDAVLLVRAASSAGARSLLEFLRDPKALATIQRFGYGPP
jgi:molybdate transport system substrate-binding protein